MSAVVVFGSLHYDIMVDAPALPRIGETVAGHGWQPKCGGKGLNQAVAAAEAGVPAAMVGAVGNDAFGEALLAHLDRAGVDRRHVRLVPGAGSGMSVAITQTGGDYGAVIASGANLLLGEADVESAQEMFAQAKILVLQNEVPDAANLTAARAARARGVLVLLNAAPARALSPELAENVDVLVANAVEAEMLGAADTVDSLAEAQEAAEALARTFRTAIVTAGGHGVAAARMGEAPIALPAVPVTVKSTHGAGDAFIGHLAGALARGENLAAGLRAANAAAARLISGT